MARNLLDKANPDLREYARASVISKCYGEAITDHTLNGRPGPAILFFRIHMWLKAPDLELPPDKLIGVCAAPASIDDQQVNIAGHGLSALGVGAKQDDALQGQPFLQRYDALT